MVKVVKTLALVLAAGVLLGAGLACNTTEGVGKDIKGAGQGLENAADRNK